MTPERYHRIKALFHAALDQDPQDRDAFLSEACFDDLELRGEVDALLKNDQQDSAFLENPPFAAQNFAASMIGRRIGAYEIIRELGTGGMGVVYLASRADGQFSKQVAVKLIKPGMDIVAIHQRFKTEQQLLAGLEHPNIARLIDAGTSGDGLSYFIMEFVEGVPIDVYCEEHSLRLLDRLKLFRVVCSAVQHAHESNVVHRDLKTSNILVTADGIPKLIDFGIAKLLSAETDGSTTTTMVGWRPMTPEYASPEQVRGESLTPASDIYSLGVILYKLVTRQQPYHFKTLTPQEVERIVCTEEPEKPSIVIRSTDDAKRRLLDPVSKNLDNIVLMALRKDPERRYGAAATLSDDIGNLLEGLPVMARKGAVLHPRLHRRKKVAVAFVAFALITMATVLASLFTQKSNPSELRYTLIAGDPERENFAAWSPDGGSIAYVKGAYLKDGVNRAGQVFVKDFSSSASKQITRGTADSWRPFWDPGGRRIYYFTESALWFVDPKGGSAQRMFENVVAAAISFDGKSLALVRVFDKKRELWISTPPGTQPERYAYSPAGSIDSKIEFSPDGNSIGAWITSSQGAGFWLLPYPSGKARKVPIPKEISENVSFAFMPDSKHVLFGTPPWTGGHLTILDTTDGSHQPFTRSYHSEERDPAVSRDGRRIAFTSGRSDNDIVEIPLDGSSIRNLIVTSESEVSPCWARSENQLLYSASRKGVYGIWLTNVRDGSSRPVVTAHDFDPHKKIRFDSPSFSPDGQRIAYQATARGGSIQISNIAGGKAVELVSEKYFADGPSWSPDGEWICFLSSDPTGSQNALAKIRVDGSGKPEILKKGITYVMPRWSPNGDRITITTPEGLELISPDGRNNRFLSKGNWGPNCWSPDGSIVYALQLNEEKRWLLRSVDVNTGQAKTISDLGRTQHYLGLSLSADGASVVTSEGRVQTDIWMVEGFDLPSGLLSRLWQKIRASY